LDSGVGVDTLVGGAGDDSYIVNDISDLILEKISAGKDWIFTSNPKVHEAFLSGEYANVEEIKFSGPPPPPKPGDPSDKDDRLVGTPEFDEIDGGKGNDTISGLAENDRLIGSEGNDSLDGGEGDDKLSGGAGNDTMVVDSAKDVVIENSNEGVDTIVSKITYTLATLQNVENIVLFGASNLVGTSDDVPKIDANLNATGNAARNSLFGNSGKNSLNGAGGADSLIGGDGSDTLNGGSSDGVADYLSGGNGDDVFILDSALDSLDGGSGRDIALSSFSFSLASQSVQGVENLIYSGRSAVTLRGNQFDNSIVGSEGNQTLFGDAGEDTLSGYAGKDWLDAGLGNDFLDGGLGPDTMIGGEGDDTYAFRDLGDNVSEGPRGSGNDVLHAFISATLSAGIETLLLVGSEPINGTGNNSANVLIGNSENNLIMGLGGADTLDGGGGANILDGGAGDDYYIIDGTVDTILESSGTDTIETRGDNFDLRNKSYFKKIENIVLAGSSRTAYGNDSDNVIKPKNASDTLSYALFGGLGNDSLLGAQGRDLLEGNEGDDTLLSGGLADSLGNTLRGGAGKDSLFAGAGNDLLLGGSSASFGFSDADVDEANNMDTLVGGDGNDTLDGGLGADSMLGGEGNDIYTLDNKADRIVEKLNEGIDAVVSSLSIDFSSIKASIENATLLGSQNLFLTANDSNNLVAGNKGSNRISGLKGNDTLLGGDGRDTLLGGEDSDSLDGGLGADSLVGSNGDDSYLVDAGGDQVIEKAGFDTGIDHVFSAVNFDPVSPWLVEFGFGPDLDDGSPSITKQKSFASIDRSSFQNLENFTFIESAVRGIGNAENNFFTGNERDNIILAQGGDDTITGGLGDDSLYGESDGLYATRADLESLNPRPDPDFSALVKFLEDEITGGALGVGRDSLVGGEGNDYLDAGALNDTMVGGSGDDTMVVDNEEDDVREVAGEGDDWVRASVNVNLLGENIENLFLRIKPQTIWQKANAGGASIGQKVQEAPANLGTGNADSNLVVASYSTYDPFTSEDETITQFPETPVQFIPGRRVNGTSFALDWEAPDSLSNSVPYTQYIVQFRRSGTSQWITFDEQVDKTANDINVTGLTSGLRYDFQVLATGFTTLRGLNGSDTILGGDYSLEIRQLGDADETITLYTVDGASFRESLVGGNGNDYLDGGLGIDTLEGGFGNDTLVVDDLADAMREFGAENGTTDGAQKLFGKDLVLSRINLDLDDQIVDRGKFIEDLTAVEGAGDLVLRGNRLDNFIAGNDQANSLFGERGNDTIAGGHANDQIFGDDGNDLLVGAVYSGLSVGTFKSQIDTLTGGNGNDVFRLLTQEGDLHYEVSGSTDYALITDFEPGKDRIERGEGTFRFGLALPPEVSSGLSIYYIPPVPFPIPDLIAVVQARDGSTLTLNTPGI
jgi:Ca2+-binding RTX toxin-like protein